MTSVSLTLVDSQPSTPQKVRSGNILPLDRTEMDKNMRMRHARPLMLLVPHCIALLLLLYVDQQKPRDLTA